MDKAIWNLPGPSEYINKIRHDLQDGKNILFLLPKFHPTYLQEMVANISHESDRSFRPLDLDKYSSSIMPNEILYEEFIPPIDCDTKPLIPALIENEHFSRGMVIWLNGLSKPVWDIWRPFIIEYEHLCRNISEYNRTVFCVPLAGDLMNNKCDTNVALASLKWSGYVKKIDVLLYISRLMKQRTLHPLHSKLMHSLIVELAGFDLKLAQELAFAELEILLHPHKLLTDIARKRGWDSNDLKEVAWKEGMTDIFEGTELISAALIACNGDKKEIQRRVWKGQIAVLFPFLEEQRIKLLPELKSYLKLPFESKFGPITDIEDLELGHILYIIVSEKIWINPKTFRLLKCLTEMRHALAHLKPVPIKYLLLDEILNL